MTRRLAIIPARGGSKRVPRKNIRLFHDRPMIAHILATAEESELFDVIHVSTEDDEIAEVASSLGHPPAFRRPDDLAADNVGLFAVIKQVTEQFAKTGEAFDEVWLLMACSPLILANDLRGAARLFAHHSGAHPVLAISPYPVPVEWAFDRAENGLLTAVQPDMLSVSSKSISPKYHDTGTFAVFSSQRIFDSGPDTMQDDFVGYEIPRQRGIDIDNQEDWELAWALFQVRNQK
tara:strand:+ start:318 stop:1019 length:702 start_codon:yes stop_codon:yes gene_type:complete